MMQELHRAWTAMVQLDNGCTEDAAARSVDACLAGLVASSLVSFCEGASRTAWRKDAHGCEFNRHELEQAPELIGRHCPNVLL